MARLTWQNVAAPDLSSSASAMAQAGRAFQNAFAGFGDIARGIQDDKMNAASNAELARLAQVGTADQVDAYLQGISGRVNPNLMNRDLVRAIGGLRGNAQGYDTTSLNQSNTRSIMNQRAKDAQYKEDLTKQSAALNADLNRAYKLQESGRHAEAQQIIERSLAQNPIAASVTDVGGVNQNLRTIQSAPDAGKFTEQGRLYTQVQQPVIEAALSVGFDAQSVKNAAYDAAIERGLSQADANRLADEAVSVFNSLGTRGADNALPNSVPDSGASNVDRVLGGVPATPSLVPTTSPLDMPATLGGLPLTGSEAPVDAAASVDSVLSANPVPGSPEPVADVPAANPTAPAIPEMADTTDPAVIRAGIDADMSETMTRVRTAQRQYSDALNIQGSESGQKAYDIFSKGAGGLDLEEGKLLGSLNEEDKSEGKRLLNSAIIKVSRQGKVSEEAAKAAILATLDPTNWYGALSSPSADISAAVAVAKQLSDPEQRNEFSKRGQNLADTRTRMETLNTEIDADLVTLANIQSNPRAMTPAARQKAEDKVKNRIATKTAELNKVITKSREIMGLAKPPQTKKSPDPDPRAQVQLDPATGLTAESSVNSATPSQIIEAIMPALMDAGMTGKEINENARSIEAEVNRLVNTSQKTSRVTGMVNRQISDIVDSYVSSNNPAVISRMSPEEIEEAAITQDNSNRPYGAQRDAAVWGNIKKALPNTKAFDKFKDMTPTELRRSSPELLPLLEEETQTQDIPIADIVQKIVTKYSKK